MKNYRIKQYFGKFSIEVQIAQKSIFSKTKYSWVPVERENNTMNITNPLARPLKPIQYYPTLTSAQTALKGILSGQKPQQIIYRQYLGELKNSALVKVDEYTQINEEEPLKHGLPGYQNPPPPPPPPPRKIGQKRKPKPTPPPAPPPTKRFTGL